jgi:putative transposase
VSSAIALLDKPAVPPGNDFAEMNRTTSDHKHVKHFNEPGHIHELTFSCYHQLPLLQDEKRCEMLAESIDRALENHKFALVGYVFMPDHVPLLVYPIQDASNIDALLFAIKRPFSFRVKKRLEDEKSPLLGELTVKQRPGVMTFRFWQEGPGYDRNITNPKTAFSAIDYIHMNPVRRGLCSKASEWKWSSAEFYQNEGRAGGNGLPRLHKIPEQCHPIAQSLKVSSKEIRLRHGRSATFSWLALRPLSSRKSLRRHRPALRRDFSRAAK